MCSPVLNSNRGVGFFTFIRVSTPFGARGGATGAGGGFGTAALVGTVLATAVTGACTGAALRGAAGRAFLAGFRRATAAFAAGLRAACLRAAACFFTGFGVFRAAAAAGLRLTLVFFPRVAFF